MHRILTMLLVIVMACSLTFGKGVKGIEPFAEGSGYKIANGNVVHVDKLSTDAYSGKFVIVPFFSTYCGPCMTNLPKLIKIYEQYKRPDVVLFGIAIEPKNGEERLLRILLKAGVEGTVLCEFQGWYSSVAKRHGIKGVPYYVLLDKNGRVLTRSTSFRQVFSVLKRSLKK